jgi:hypothetical protein
MLDIKMEVGHSAETAFGTIVERTYFLKEISNLLKIYQSLEIPEDSASFQGCFRFWH